MHVVISEPLGVDPVLFSKKLNVILKDNSFEIFSDRVTDTNKLIERCKDADILVLTNNPLSKEVLQNCPKLKYICVAFTGYNHIDMDFCNENNILVSNCSGYSTDAVSELVFGLIFNLYRHIHQYNVSTRNSGTNASLLNLELSGKKFGIIGLGTIGKKVASIAQVFGCEVYYYSKNKKDVDYQYLPLDELLKTCDIISIHTAQNKDTIKLLNKDNLALMKENSVLINTARGPIVDYEVLSDLLTNNKILGAGIDVFETEPPITPDHPLFKADNCVVTPHIGFYTKEALEKRSDIVLKNIEAYLNNQPINIVK